MAPTIVVIAMGEMGAAIGQRLRLRGTTVRSSLAGRGAATIARAKAAGIAAVENDAVLVEGADLILSVVPPGEALGLARRLAPALTRAAVKPVYADCNAVAPQTVAEVAAVIAPTGCAFADIGIIGGPPPKEGTASPRLYVSGPAAGAAMRLKEYGLDMRLLEGGVGLASALKMAYATLTKGGQAIGISMMLGAMQGAVAPALRQEIAASQPDLAQWLQEQVPRIYPKAYRWVAEMEEIAKTLAAYPGAAEMLNGAAKIYAQMAKDAETLGTPGNTIDLLDAFLGRP
jgi:putative dehydrogenase